MGNIVLTIDDKKVFAPQGSTILKAAMDAGIFIPTLCFLKGLDPKANCRICVVEVEGSRTFQPACSTMISENMVVRTNTPAVCKSRKTTLQLLLARHSVECHHCMRIGSSKCDDLDPFFCEMCFWCDCVRDGICELQALAREYKVDVLPYELEPGTEPLDESTRAIVRNPNKCIKCRRCIDVCNDVQTVQALGLINRGPEINVMPAQGKSLADSPCVQCGRCIDVCPTGAIYAYEKIDKLLYNTHRYDVKTIAQLSSDIYAELAVLCKIAPSALDPKAVVAGLHKIGVDYVVADDYATSQANSVLYSYLESKVKEEGTLIVSDSYSATKFANQYFPDISGRVFTYDSAQKRFGKIAKTTWVERMNMDPEKLCTISISSRNEYAAEAVNQGSVDFVLNARELYRLFLRTGVNLNKIIPMDFDELVPNSATNPLAQAFYQPIDWAVDARILETDLTMGGETVKAAVTSTLGDARQLLEQVQGSCAPYRVIKLSS